MKKKIIISAIFVVVILIGIIWGITKKQKKIEDIIIIENIDEILEIVYTRDTRKGTITRDGKFWYFEGEDLLVADRAIVEEQLEILSTISPKSIVKNNKNKKSFGLEEPKYSISVKNDNGQKKTIYVGNATEEKDYYIRIDDQEEIYIVSKEIRDVIVRFDSQQRMYDRFDAYTTPTR